MRAIIMLALLATANADVGGYNYGIGLENISNGGSLSGGSLSDGSLSGGSVSGGSLGIGSLTGSSLTGASAVDFGSNSQPDYSSGNTEFNKEFFTYSAPESDFEDNRSVGDLAASLKRNLRVLFIRAPENKGLENAAVALAKQAAEQQTAIYVLTKQGDLTSLANKLQNLNNINAKKPEVHFVKYRTPEDAINAQRTIQQEYDRLGGSSTLHNAGIAPVLDFASKQVIRQPQQPQQPLQLLNERRAGAVNLETHGNGNGASIVSELEPPAAFVAPAAGSPSSTYLPVNKVN